jgi:hypothetical protein
MSHLIAEELSKLKVKFNKKNETRWNSILFMIDSVLKVTPNQFKEIQDKMPDNTRQQRRVKKFFYLKAIERDMLKELQELLQMFKCVSDDLQSNKVSISYVYPSINTIIIKLKKGLKQDFFHCLMITVLKLLLIWILFLTKQHSNLTAKIEMK